MRKVDLNNFLDKDSYLTLCKCEGVSPMLDVPIPVPDSLTFQKKGQQEPGYCLVELNEPPTETLLEGATDESIGVLLQAGVQEIHLVIWAPERPNGFWKHHIRRILTRSPWGVLTNKLALAQLVGAEYAYHYERMLTRRPAPDDYPLLDPAQARLVRLCRLGGCVYQAELTVGSRTPNPPLPLGRTPPVRSPPVESRTPKPVPPSVSSSRRNF